MPRPPLWLIALGLMGNSMVFAVMFFRGNPFWQLFLFLALVNYFSIVHRTAVRTAERNPCSSTGSTPSS
jgi:hypothetical protein